MTPREISFVIIGILAGATTAFIACVFVEIRRLNKELNDARFWTGWHKGWTAGWESCRQPKEAEPRSCSECKHALCSMDSEPCKTCITRSKFEAIEE